jgi:hypothetical protein
MDADPAGTLQARAWARVARARARVDSAAGAEANRELFDALQFAATEARLALDELVDAYTAGAPDLELGEAWEDVEDYLPPATPAEACDLLGQRIATAHEHHLDSAFAWIERALPDWRRRLGLRIAAHDLALAAHHVVGGQDERVDLARRSVAEVLEGARAADASEDELDAFLAQLRAEQCDLLAAIAAAAWIAAERARLATSRSVALPAPAWATPSEVAEHRGVAIDVVEPLLEDALQRGLLLDHDRGVAVTAAGHEYLAQATRP